MKHESAASSREALRLAGSPRQRKQPDASPLQIDGKDRPVSRAVIYTPIASTTRVPIIAGLTSTPRSCTALGPFAPVNASNMQANTE